ncbi:MAG: phosphodiester glycosidase family protein [Clostridia bacterium]|nr:phosphodiester glycosidase family protein [Clostridia bacterium]
MLKRLTALLLALLLFIPVSSTALLFTTEDGAFPALNEAGFIDKDEFVYENEKDGVWRYCSDTLKVEIFRREQAKPARVWYEAEVWAAEGETLRMIPNDAGKWMKSTDYPYKIARKNRTVLAVSSDYAHLRIQKKQRTGIIIRGGVIYGQKTRAKNKGTFPNLDCMALYPDGDMKVFWSDEKTAEEYLEDGAYDVLAFGPWLIRDGELNETGLKKYGTSKAQRTAVGMVEKGHYFLMMLEGRITRSKGDTCAFLAEKLLEKGCVTAMNLDGGQTSSIVFMGHQLCRMKNGTGNLASRRTADILGIGTSEYVRETGDPF